MDTKLHTATIPIADYNELMKSRTRDYKEILIGIFGNQLVINKEDARLIDVTINDRNFVETLPPATDKTKNAMWRALHNKLIVLGVKHSVAVVPPAP